MEATSREYYRYINGQYLLLCGGNHGGLPDDRARLPYNIYIWCNLRWSNYPQFPCDVVYWRGHPGHEPESWLSKCPAKWVITESYSSTCAETRDACANLGKNFLRIWPENPYLPAPCMGVLALHHLQQCHPACIGLVGMGMETVNKEHEPERCKEYIDECIAWNPERIARVKTYPI